MKYKHIKGLEIEGDLDIVVTQSEDDFQGLTEKWDEVLIHGNREGLKSLAKLLLEIAELNQEKVEDKYLPNGAREHYHLKPNIDLSANSVNVFVGRLDAKGTGEYYKGFIPKKA
jgi:hypothetical protein